MFRFDVATLNREFLQGFFKTPVQIILLIGKLTYYCLHEQVNSLGNTIVTTKVEICSERDRFLIDTI